MIKKQVFFLILFFLTANPTKAEILTVEVTSEHKDGPVLLAVYDKQEYFGKTKANQKANPKHILLGAKGLISNYKGKVTFDLPYGNYVIAGIHDLDNNGVLTGNFLGMPKEPFGFSNNKRGNFGPPKWKDVLIKFNESNKKIIAILEEQRFFMTKTVDAISKSLTTSDIIGEQNTDKIIENYLVI